MAQDISFTQIIKEEISSLTLNDEEKRSFLSAFIKISGTLIIGKENKISLVTENAHIAKKVYEVIKDVYPESNVTFGYRKAMNFYKATQFLININYGINTILEDLNMKFFDSKIPYELTDKESKISGYLKGLFLASGSCNDPKSSNYHLEITTKDEMYGKAILKMINKIKSVKFDFKMIKRRSNYVIYLKKSDQISSFLAFIDATDSCLSFEQIRLDRDFSNISNRIEICDIYNYKRITDKANETIKDIELIEQNLGLSHLDNEKLIELCKLRKENPEASYNDLAELLSEKMGTKVTKSNVAHLFRKIKEIAEDYK